MHSNWRPDVLRVCQWRCCFVSICRSQQHRDGLRQTSARLRWV